VRFNASRMSSAAAIDVMPTSLNDPYNLQRFVEAQNPVFEQVCAELRAGRKSRHWMWFVFPQIKGLGNSETSRKFAIASRAEAEAYLEHPILGARLRECSRLVTLVHGRTAVEIFGPTDELKLRSSLTLFSAVTSDNKVFVDALQKYFAGEPDDRTLLNL
jgi:uncharacterized protein (DUF1810 family)